MIEYSVMGMGGEVVIDQVGDYKFKNEPKSEGALINNSCNMSCLSVPSRCSQGWSFISKKVTPMVQGSLQLKTSVSSQRLTVVQILETTTCTFTWYVEAHKTITTKTPTIPLHFRKKLFVICLCAYEFYLCNLQF